VWAGGGVGGAGVEETWTRTPSSHPPQTRPELLLTYCYTSSHVQLYNSTTEFHWLSANWDHSRNILHISTAYVAGQR
jgi:hypothetical protein